MKHLFCVLFALLPIIAMASDKKDDCAIEKFLLQPGPGNRCLEALITQVKNPDDHKFILEMQRTWNPPKDLRIERVANGIVAFAGGKMLFDGRWLSDSPVLLFWNGKIKAGQSQASGSIRQMIHALIHEEQPATSAWLILLPTAVAAEETTAENIFSVFTMQSQPGKKWNALQELAYRFRARPDRGPETDSGSTQCTKKGIESKYELKDISTDPYFSDLKFPIQTKEIDIGKYLVTGVIPGKTILVETMKKPDGTYELADTRNHAKIEVCQEADCATHAPLFQASNSEDLAFNILSKQQLKEARAVADQEVKERQDAHEEDVPKGSDLFNSRLTRFSGNLWAGIASTAVDAIAFGECCKQEPCRDLIKKMLKIDLLPATDSGATP